MIVIDMDMPKCCSDCELCYDEIYCTISGRGNLSDESWFEDMDTKRLDSCPIKTELPKKHGRLIDADMIQQDHFGDSYVYLGAEVRRILENAPTILEGSEEE